MMASSTKTVQFTIGNFWQEFSFSTEWLDTWKANTNWLKIYHFLTRQISSSIHASTSIFMTVLSSWNAIMSISRYPEVWRQKPKWRRTANLNSRQSIVRWLFIIRSLHLFMNNVKPSFLFIRTQLQVVKGLGLKCINFEQPVMAQVKGILTFVMSISSEWQLFSLKG